MKAQVTSLAAINWNSGAAFDGFVVLSMTLPTGYDRAMLRTSSPFARVPTKIKLPVKQGVYDPASAYIWRTDYLVPPGTVYTTTWYDSTGKQIAVDATTRTVTASSYTLDPPTLPVP